MMLSALKSEEISDLRGAAGLGMFPDSAAGASAVIS